MAKPKVYGYIRASTTKQKASLEKQKERILEFMRQHAATKFAGCEFGGFFIDEESGTYKRFEDRKMGKKLNSLMVFGDHLVCVSPERMGRNMVQGLLFIEKCKCSGVSLHFCEVYGVDASTPEGEAYIQMRLMFAQYDAKIISRRQTEDQAWRRRQGLPTSSLQGPIGWRSQKFGPKTYKYVVNEKEVARASELGRFYAMRTEQGARHPEADTMTFWQKRKDLWLDDTYPNDGRRKILNRYLHACWIRFQRPFDGGFLPHPLADKYIDFTPAPAYLTGGFGYLREFDATSYQPKKRRAAKAAAAHASLAPLRVD